MKNFKKLLTLILTHLFLLVNAWGGDSILAHHKNPPPSTDSTPTNCSWDLSGVIFTEIDSANCISGCTTQYPQRTYGVTNSDYKDVSYPPSTQPNCGGSGGAPVCITSFTNTLVYYVYWPKHNYDPNNGGCTLPAMILVHAGSFSDCSGINPGKEIKLLAREFAKRGFVTFVVEYRRGNLPHPDFFDNIRYISAQQMLAAYRAGQDVKGFVRSIIFRQNNHSTYADPYQIDINKLFIGGASAGGSVAINVAYYQDQEDQIDPISPRIVTGQQLVSDGDILGDVDQLYYDCNTCQQNIYPKILGVMSMWGAGYLPPANATNIPTASSYFDGNTSIPAFIGFHGLNDITAYPYFHNAYFPDDELTHVEEEDYDFYVNYARGSNCLLNSSTTYIQNNPDDVYDLVQGGSQMIYEILRYNCIPAELYIDSDMEHGLDTDGIEFDSDFGTNLGNSVLVYTYMVQRSATFFQAVMNGYGNELGDSKFVDCENERVQCNRPYNSECGTNAYDCD